jgi:hypothetical protein
MSDDATADPGSGGLVFATHDDATRHYPKGLNWTFRLADMITERVSNTNGTSTNFSNFDAGGAGLFNFVTHICLINTSGAFAYVDFRDGSAGSIIWTFPLPSEGGVVLDFSSAPLKQDTANTALAFDVSAAVSTVLLSLSGFQHDGV